MRQIHFATTNAEKVRSLREAFKRNGLEDVNIIHCLLELLEPRSSSVLEIATKKASFAYSEIGTACVVQDTGFFIDSLNGFPGPYVNFCLEKLGIEGILKLAEGKSRNCRFEHCLAYQDQTLGFKFFTSITRGLLTSEQRGGNSKYPLHRIFIPEGESRTLAKMNEQERDKWRQLKVEHYTNDFARWYRDNVKSPIS